jgi:arginine exporter protein ArgO
MIIFSAFGFAQTSYTYWTATLITLGVFLGSAAWWLLLSNGVALFRTRVTPLWMRRVNQVSGAVIVAFAVAILLKLRA